MLVKSKGKKRDLIPLFQSFINQFGSSAIVIDFTEYWNYAAPTDVVSVNIEIKKKSVQSDVERCVLAFYPRDNYKLEIVDIGVTINANSLIRERNKANKVRESYNYESVKLDAFDDLELYEDKLKGNYDD